MWRIKLWVLFPVALIGFLIHKVRGLGRAPADQEMTPLEEITATKALVDELVREGDIEPEDAEGLAEELLRLRDQRRAAE